MAAEFIGLGASIITIASLTKPTIRIIKSLDAVANGADPIAGQIELMISQIQGASATIECSLRSLIQHDQIIRKTGRVDWPVARFLHCHKIVDSFKRYTKLVRKRISLAKNRIDSLEEIHSVFRVLKWHYSRKTEVMSLLLLLDRLSYNLAIVCDVLRMEWYQHLVEVHGGAMAEWAEAEYESLGYKHEKYEASGKRLLNQDYGISDLQREFRKVTLKILCLSVSMRTSKTVPEDKSWDHQSTGSETTRSGYSSSLSPGGQSIRIRVERTRSQSTRPQRPASQRPVMPFPPAKPEKEADDRPVGKGIPKDMTVPRVAKASAVDKKRTPTLPVEVASWYYTNSTNRQTFPCDMDPNVVDNYMPVWVARDLGINFAELDPEDAAFYTYPGERERRKLVGKVDDIKSKSGKGMKNVDVKLWIEDCYSSSGRRTIIGAKTLRETGHL